MRKTMTAIAGTASLIATCATAEAAGTFGQPLIDRNSSFSVAIEEAMTSILRPLDAATQSLNTFVKPVTGSSGFAPAPVSMPMTKTIDTNPPINETGQVNLEHHTM